MKKKILVMTLVIALLAICITGASLAYFSDSDEAENVFTMGNVEIDLLEPEWDPTEDAPFVPGVEYGKNPYVTNTGDTPAYIRMKVTFSNSTAFQLLAENHQMADWAPWRMLRDVDYSGDVNSTDTGWQTMYSMNGIYDTENDTVTYVFYYREPLQPGKSTSELFQKVQIPEWFTESDRELFGIMKTDPDTGKKTMEYRFDIDIVAEAIQTADSFVDSDPVDDVTDKDYYKAFEAFDQEKATQTTAP